MSKSYPSRRELRLQREREERAKLRDAEVQRWAAERDTRQTSSIEADNVTPDNPQASELDDTGSFGRRAAAHPVDAPADVEEAAMDAPPGTRRRRRADSEITSTGMLPIISKPQPKKTADRPLSRREMREVEERRAAERRAEIARLQREQARTAEVKPARRATAPQTSPIAITPIISPVAQKPAPTRPPATQPESDVEVTLGDVFAESATEITDMSGLDTIEIRRAELRAETERLTQEILEMGQSNPNVIDPVMLRRQKELAEKSKELQDLETAAIALVEEAGHDHTPTAQEPSKANATEPSKSAQLFITSPAGQSTGTAAKPPIAEELGSASSSKKVTSSKEPARPERDTTKPTRRRHRRAQSGPMITGPFDVDEQTQHADKPAPVPSAELFEELHRPTKSSSSSGEPVDASEAHGLDSLDAKDFEAPERRMVMSSAIVFAIGIIALITAIILLIR